MRKNRSKDISLGIALIMLVFTGLLTIFVLSYNPQEKPQAITGMATGVFGCCEDFCAWKDEVGCKETFTPGKQCYEVDSCRVGCCISKEGYCYPNYLKGKCERQGNNYIQKECSEMVQCTDPSTVSKVMEPVGIRLEYDPVSGDFINKTDYIFLNNYDYTVAEPYSSFKGSFIEIRYSVADNTQVQNVIAIIKDEEGNNYRINLFDDGAHNDGSPKDKIYGNVWDSSLIQSTGIKRFSIDIEVIRKDGRKTSATDISRFLVSSDVRCIPLNGLSESLDALNIVLLGNGYRSKGGIEIVERDIRANIETMSHVNPFASNLFNINYYMISSEYQFATETEAKEAIIRECVFFNTSTDLAIIFDYNEQKCRKLSEEGNIFTLSPESYYVRGSKASLSDIRDDVCKVAKTGLEVAESLKEGAPSVDILTENNINLWTNENDIVFLLDDDKDLNVSYSIYVDGSLDQRGLAEKGMVTARKVTLEDGQHSIYVSASDSEGNSRISSTITLNVNGSFNYVAKVMTPEIGQVLNETQAEVSFIISHPTAKNVSYSLFIGDVEKDSGIVDVEVQKSIRIININQGSHEVMVYSEDAEGRKTQSEKIMFEVKVAES